MTCTERFLRYVAIHTTSDESSGQHPSSARQLELSRLLAEELRQLKLQDVHIDTCGNVIATLPGNAPAPAVALIAHVDTVADAPGENIHPSILRSYDGGDIQLAAGPVMRTSQFEYLPGLKGTDLIVTDGTTLLGADDKAGVAEIMTMVANLVQSDRPHGELRVVFTTDEEIGEGVDGLDVAELNCRYAYTVDGGPIGEIEFENFNAASAVVRIHGLGIHPGSAKDKMINAAAIAAEFQTLLPAAQTPEHTEGYEGFLHLRSIQADVTEATMAYLVRDHSRDRFEQKKDLLTAAAAFLNAKYGPQTVDLTLTDSYYNMREKVEPEYHLITRAEAAFRANGVTPVSVPIRGGTDGARLSWMGLPCPNLSTGGYGFHGVYECIPVQSLETMPKVLEDLLCGFVEG